MKNKKIIKKLPKNWRNLIEIEEIKYSRTEYEYILRFKQKIKYYDRDIGYIDIIKDRNLYFVKVVSVVERMRGKGCGMMLY